MTLNIHPHTSRFYTFEPLLLILIKTEYLYQYKHNELRTYTTSIDETQINIQK